MARLETVGVSSPGRVGHIYWALLAAIVLLSACSSDIDVTPGTSGTGPTTTIELPDEAEMPAEVLGLGNGSAMLNIDRSLEVPLGSFEITADFTLNTFHGLVGEPGQTNKISGSTESEFAVVITGIGATGISHTTTMTGPLLYEVEGTFHPESGGCTFDLTVTETAVLSQVTSVVNTALGELPVPPEGAGADVITSFDVQFDEKSLDFFVIAGEHSSSFTLYDVGLPDGTGCSFTG